MSILQTLEKNKENLFELVINSYSYKEIAKEMGYSEHGRNTSAIKLYLIKNGFDTSHFVPGNKPAIFIDRTCPVCGGNFRINPNNSKESLKTTCSHGCANTYFRSGKLAGNYKHGNTTYAKDITDFHEQHNLELHCRVCHYNEVLDIHHADEDRNNNEIVNLVPLCPNYHAKWHRHKDNEVFEAIVSYQDLIINII